MGAAATAGQTDMGFARLARAVDDAADDRHRYRRGDVGEPLLEPLDGFDALKLLAHAGRTRDHVIPRRRRFSNFRISKPAGCDPKNSRTEDEDWGRRAFSNGRTSCVDAEIMLQLSVQSHQVRVEVGLADIYAARIPPVGYIPFAVLQGPRRSITTLLTRVASECPHVGL